MPGIAQPALLGDAIGNSHYNAPIPQRSSHDWRDCD